jgi:hypothetical protein
MNSDPFTCIQSRFAIAGGVLAVILCAASASAQKFEHKERHLGPTGLFGVTSPKDIRIVKVAAGSPADGILKPGDVIVAAGGKPFQQQTRRQFAEAIDMAEGKEAGGVLRLKLADGRELDVKLPVIGSYADTAPFQCTKTEAIITRAADHLVKTRKFGRGDMNIGLLGLLATGEPKYIEVVREVIHAAPWAKPDLSLTLDKYARTAWSWGYTTLLLCEYYLLTQDEYVLPAIREYSVAIASGRDAAGLWGHGMATRDLNGGQLHGRLPGYAVMNQSSLPCFISLLLADKCGIRHPEIQAGIEQTHTFYADFIGKGTLPYGVHNPNARSFNNNGMSGLAAVAFSLKGNREGSEFFSRMCVAGHQTQEQGHTGHFFSQLWTGPGANLAGQEAHSAFFHENRWLHTLNRSWDGGFTYDCSEYNGANYSYRGLSDSGSHLLNHCLPRRKLFITGRDADPSIHLTREQIKETISLASLDMKTLPDEELLARFGHPLPKVRHEAVSLLQKRPHQLLGEIQKMVIQGDGQTRLSALQYFGNQCAQEQSAAALDDLKAVLQDPSASMETRAAAAEAISFHGEAAYPVYQDMLALLAAEKPDDPLGRIDESLGSSLVMLSANPYEEGLITNKELFYTAARKLLQHRRAGGRASGGKLIAHIPREDLPRVADLLLHIIADEDRSYHAYHNLDPQTQAISVLANNRIEGGIEAAFAILDSPVGKYGFKVRMLMEVLPKYGAAAKPYLPRLREMNAEGRFAKPWAAMIQSIESATDDGELIPLNSLKSDS